MTSLHARINAQKRFDEVDEFTKDDLVSSLEWARETLTNHEGAGHHFSLLAEGRDQFVCAFAKPQWSGDHSTEPRPTAADAIVWAVCTYLAGM